jgi:glycosyltransferase involved in cell wall biosynthesis
MVYIEPTPYITALIDTLRRLCGAPIESYFISSDISQSWNLRMDDEWDRVLPKGFFAKMRILWAALIRERERTVLHLAGWGHPVLLGAMFMARSLQIPMAVESDTVGRQWDHTWRRWFKTLLYPLLFRVPNRFLPGGTRQAKYLAGFGVQQGRMTIAQMTVDVCAIRQFCAADRKTVRSNARMQWGMLASEKIVLFMGRLEGYKGVEVLLSAFARAAKEENKLRLVIGGEGSLRPLVETIAADAEHRVTYLGRLSGDDVWRAYLAADFLVLPSLSESWGLVVNEAMACGLPVIVSDRVGCADDLVPHGETGLVIGTGHEVELASAIRRLAREEPDRRRMGLAAENLISNWTLCNEARNIMSAWDEITP